MSAWVYRGHDTYACSSDAWSDNNSIRCPKCRNPVKSNHIFSTNAKATLDKEVNVVIRCNYCKDGVRLEVWFNSDFAAGVKPYVPQHVQNARAKAKAAVPPPANQEWRIPGSSFGTIHTVKVNSGVWSCTCQDHRIRKHDCKHIRSKKMTVAHYANQYTP